MVDGLDVVVVRVRDSEGWEMLSFFLEGHTTHGGGAMRELWPMAISVTLYEC